VPLVWRVLREGVFVHQGQLFESANVIGVKVRHEYAPDGWIVNHAIAIKIGKPIHALEFVQRDRPRCAKVDQQRVIGGVLPLGFGTPGLNQRVGMEIPFCKGRPHAEKR
jgi:hypothetical protein